MMRGFHCLMYSGLPFSEEIREFLVETARRMSREKATHKAFRSDTYEGEVRTKFTPYFVTSTLYGIMFTAEIECAEGQTMVRYLVTPESLKKRTRTEWSPWFKVNPRHPRDNAAQN